MSHKSWTFLAVAVVVLTAGCGRDPAPPTYRTLDDFSALDLSTQSLVSSATLPKPPKGFTKADVEALAGELTEMSTRGTYNRDVWHPATQDEAIRLVLLGLDRDTRTWIKDSARHSLDGRPWANVVGTVFAPDVRVIATPRMQRATWDVRRENDHGAQLYVSLQTETLYPVQRLGHTSVIAVTRTIGLRSPDPAAGYYSSFTLAVDTPGADQCDFVLRSVLRPEPDAKKYRTVMAALVAKPATGFVEPTDDDSAATAKACRRAKN
jgi:hypothetical protein